MTDTTPSGRPLSPHVQIYRWPITMAMSIAHRATGGALYFGTFLFAAWIISASMGEDAFEKVNWLFGSFLGRTILFLYTLALVHHLVGGVRHLFWDTNPALLEKNLATKTAWSTIVVSIVLTLLIWIVGYIVR